jgi:hypothetical protein
MLAAGVLLCALNLWETQILHADDTLSAGNISLSCTGVIMAGTEIQRLRIVGGNPGLKRLPNAARKPFQSTLRVVQPSDADNQPWRRALVILESMRVARLLLRKRV